MKPKNQDLHGCAPDRCTKALLIVDMLNEFAFPGAEELLRHALPAATRLAQLKRELKRQGVPVIYANDHFGRWRSDLHGVIARATDDACAGREVARLLIPEDDDYFVVKPKHSAFYATALETLLLYLDTRELIITGIAGNHCVYHTALDAHIRDYELVVPRDCMASQTAAYHEMALEQLSHVIKADTRPSHDIIREPSAGSH